MNIQTQHIHPAIPIRTCDWLAIEVDLFDDETGQPSCYARTEEEAIAGLMGKLGATCTEVAEELIGRGFSDYQVAKVMNEGAIA